MDEPTNAFVPRVLRSKDRKGAIARALVGAETVEDLRDLCRDLREQLERERAENQMLRLSLLLHADDYWPN